MKIKQMLHRCVKWICSRPTWTEDCIIMSVSDTVAYLLEKIVFRRQITERN